MALILQLRTTTRIKPTSDGKGDVVTTKFALGPFLVIVISTVPPEGMIEAPAYVKIEANAGHDWDWVDNPSPNRRDQEKAGKNE